MYIFFSCLGVIVLFVLMFLWVRKISKQKNQVANISNLVISNFEPDNVAPPLTKMIEFHNANGVINYNI